MGRMLEALLSHDAPESLPATAPEPASVDVAPDAEEPAVAISFIEVGGPRKVVDGSPDVLACPARPDLAAPTVQPAQAAPGREPEVVAEASLGSPRAAVAQVPLGVRHLPGDAAGVQFRPVRPATLVARRSLAPELIAYHQPEHAASQSYRELADRLLGETPCRGRTLLLTSAAPWAGTTTVLLNLAITAARRDKCQVIVVDANLRRPAIAERLGLPPGLGLRAVLARTLALPQALKETAQANLRALPAGCPPAATLDAAGVLAVVRQLGQLGDLVLVDGPSWNEGPEAALLAEGCEAVYLVLPHQAGAPSEPLEPLPALRQPPDNLQGYILTLR